MANSKHCWMGHQNGREEIGRKKETAADAAVCMLVFRGCMFPKFAFIALELCDFSD